MLALVWLAWLAFYLFSLSPGLGGEDSGEFAAAAVTLGVTHPPGYPLLTLAGKLASLVPLGSPAFRLNLLSAACAAFASTVLFALVRREAKARFGAGERAAVLASAAASVMLGVSQALWRQAVISDKYALNIALIAAAYFLAATGAAWPRVALVLGISFAHHLQSLYLVPGLAWLAWRRGGWTRRTSAVCATLFLLGFSAKLLYPPVRGAQDPPLLLGRVSTARQWINYVRAAQYTSKVGGPDEKGSWKETELALGGQTAWAGAVAGAAGLALWSAGAGPAGTAAWATVAAGLFLTASLRITGREFYVLPVIWLLAFGLGCLLAWGMAGSVRRRWAACGAAAVPLAILALNLPWAGAGKTSLEYDYGRDLLAGLPGRAVFFVGGDDVIYPVLYLQGVEGFRNDVTAIPEGFLTFGPERERLARGNPEMARVLSGDRWLRTEDEWSNEASRAALAAGRRVFMTNPSREGISAGLARENRDLVFEVRLAGGQVSPPGLLWMRARGWHAPVRGLTERQKGVIGLYGNYQRQYADFLSNTGRNAEALGRFRHAAVNPFLGDREGALNNYALALERAGEMGAAAGIYGKLAVQGTTRPEIFLNAGNLLLKMGKRQEAAGMFAKALELAPAGSRYAEYASGKLLKLGGK